MTLDTMERAIELLAQRGIEATLEYPGCICVEDWWFGTANEMFGGNPADGTDGYYETDVPSTCEDAERVAGALEKWVREGKGSN